MKNRKNRMMLLIAVAALMTGSAFAQERGFRQPANPNPAIKVYLSVDDKIEIVAFGPNQTVGKPNNEKLRNCTLRIIPKQLYGILECSATVTHEVSKGSGLLIPLDAGRTVYAL